MIPQDFQTAPGQEETQAKAMDDLLRAKVNLLAVFAAEPKEPRESFIRRRVRAHPVAAASIALLAGIWLFNGSRNGVSHKGPVVVAPQEEIQSSIAWRSSVKAVLIYVVTTAARTLFQRMLHEYVEKYPGMPRRAGTRAEK